MFQPSASQTNDRAASSRSGQRAVREIPIAAAAGDRLVDAVHGRSPSAASGRWRYWPTGSGPGRSSRRGATPPGPRIRRRPSESRDRRRPRTRPRRYPLVRTQIARRVQRFVTQRARRPARGDAWCDQVANWRADSGVRKPGPRRDLLGVVEDHRGIELGVADRQQKLDHDRLRLGVPAQTHGADPELGVDRGDQRAEVLGSVSAANGAEPAVDLRISSAAIRSRAPRPVSFSSITEITRLSLQWPAGRTSGFRAADGPGHKRRGAEDVNCAGMVTSKYQAISAVTRRCPVPVTVSVGGTADDGVAPAGVLALVVVGAQHRTPVRRRCG